MVDTPGLAERAADDSEELPRLVRYIVRRLLGADEATVTDEVLAWIDGNMGPDYAWPGNVRELEQCVIRSHYRPHVAARRTAPRHEARGAAHDELHRALSASALTADEMLRVYCTIRYATTGSYKEAGDRLGIDQRTLKAKVDPELLAQLRAGADFEAEGA